MVKLTIGALLAAAATMLGVVVAERGGDAVPLEMAAEADSDPAGVAAELTEVPALAAVDAPLETPALAADEDPFHAAGRRAFEAAPFEREPYTWVDEQAGVVRVKQLLTVRFPDGTERDYPATSTATPVFAPLDSVVRDGRSVVETGFDLNLRENEPAHVEEAR